MTPRDLIPATVAEAWEWCDRCQAEFGRGHAKIAHVTPGPFRWRQRRWWGWIVGHLYTLGLISSSISSGHEQGWITHALGWRGRRVYILGLKREAWGYPLHWLRYHHWPQPIFLGMCGLCCPWPCCGATGYDHEEDFDGEF